MTALLIRLFVKDQENIRDRNVREQYGRLGGTVGIICNLFLCIFKICAGVFSGAISVVADGLNNLTDMGSSVVTIIGFRIAAKPADRDHPFGHGRMEYISAFIVDLLIMLVGVELLRSSGEALFRGEAAPKYSLWTVLSLAVSVAVKLWLFFFNRKLGKKISSEALCATAQDSLNDVIASSAVLVSIVAGMILRLPFNLDALMAAGVAVFILWSGFSALKGTLDGLLGGPPEPELIDEIENTVSAFDEFLGLHDLIVHNYGPGRQFASVHVEVPHSIDITHCHEQIDLCEKLVLEKTGVQLVIHMDPIDTDNESVAAARTAIAQAITEIDPRLTLHDFRMTPAGVNRTNLIFDVVIPDDLNMTHSELKEKINLLACQINPTYTCVITIDNSFIR